MNFFLKTIGRYADLNLLVSVWLCTLTIVYCSRLDSSADVRERVDKMWAFMIESLLREAEQDDELIAV